MESILARALEYTLKYWLKSFSREQLKWQGRTVQLSNLDINGDSVHSSMGLAPALNVAKAKVRKLEIVLPYVSHVQIEPIVIQIDMLDIVLEENADLDPNASSTSVPPSSTSGKTSGYGLFDKIADGMTLEVRTVNLLLQTSASARKLGEAAWASPLASITVRNLMLYTTNENWQVVNLKDAREFSREKEFLYVFRKLEWDSLSIDLLPHPDMFADPCLGSFQDEDGAKRMFFGGERFVEGISGLAYITIQRTVLNCPSGLEVSVHIPEVVCPSLSEPGLRAFLRFLTGLHVCLNRGNVDPMAKKQFTNAAGRSLISIIIDHIFLCIKDAEFQLELLMQSLFFSRANVCDGASSRNLTRIKLGGFFLRDTCSRPPCTLIQPWMQNSSNASQRVPDFGKDFCSPIYPLGEINKPLTDGIPLFSLFSLQVKPFPIPPSFASQTVIDCQPLLIYLQEASCLRICSFLSDGISISAGVTLPDSSINSLSFSLKELDLSIPLDTITNSPTITKSATLPSSTFAGARLHIENLYLSESPTLKFNFLNLGSDPAFCLLEDQPVDASLKKWNARSSHINLSLETQDSFNKLLNNLDWSMGLWKCIEVKDACVEIVMATSDGLPLTNLPPPGGIIRVSISCHDYISSTSVEQLFFVLDLYVYFGIVAEKISKIKKSYKLVEAKNGFPRGSLVENVPSDTAVSLGLKYIHFKFLEPSSTYTYWIPLVQCIGHNLNMKIIHKSLGGAIAVTSTWQWENVRVDCLDSGEQTLVGDDLRMIENCHPQMKPVVWVHKERRPQLNGRTSKVPCLDITMVHVIPYNVRGNDLCSVTLSACISGICLGGGMSYTEDLLHRFGIFGLDGGPGEGLTKGMDNLFAGPLAKLFEPSSAIMTNENLISSSKNVEQFAAFPLGMPNDVDVSIELKDWLLSLHGAEMGERLRLADRHELSREEMFWKTTFRNLFIRGGSTPANARISEIKRPETDRLSLESVTVGIEGLKILRPLDEYDGHVNRIGEPAETFGGVGFEMVISPDTVGSQINKWTVDNLKFSAKQPIEVMVTKEEFQHLVFLCKSELDAMGRIIAGVLRIFRVEGSIGRATIDQLSNLGSEVFSSDKLSRDESTASIGLAPSSSSGGKSPSPLLESAITSLEDAILESQVTCTMLSSGLSSTEGLESHISQLSVQLEGMQRLLAQLRSQV